MQALCCPALEKNSTCNVDSHHPLVFVLDTQPQDVLTKLRQAPVCTDFHSSKYLTTADLESKYLTADLESKYLKTLDLESISTLNMVVEVT